MPLSSPTVPREHIHTRAIDARGYLREDGLWDVEAHLTDVKTYPFDNHFRGVLAPGQPVHEMWIRLTLDDRLFIHEIEAVTDASPYAICPAITDNFKRLKGLSIRPGFTGKVRELLGGTEGCTHLVELMGPLATAAYQTIYPYRERKRREGAKSPSPKPGRKPHLIDTCHAFAADGEVVKRYWPDFYTGTSSGNNPTGTRGSPR
ncbi:MAG TPA: DUF2889 domain-containing protein [Stellaceae bacterium]|nr:DUF2889 domain-containing protein [Stellaceae bacterium]